MASEYHEPYEQLPAEATRYHRVIQSVIEEPFDELMIRKRF